MKTSIVARNAAVDALVALANNGFVKVYTGSEPATPETAASGTLLATATFGASAFGASASGTATAAAISPDTSIDATGTAGYFRVLKSDATTVLWQGTVTATGGGGDMTVNTVSFVAAAQFSITSLTFTLPQ